MRERPPRRDAPLPQPGTLLLNAILTEDAVLDLRGLPPGIHALLESDADGALDVAADWLEENGRLESADLLRHGTALLLEGMSAFRWGLLKLIVAGENELLISGVCAARSPLSGTEHGRWTLLANRAIFVLEPSLVDIRHRQSSEESSMVVHVVGRRASGLW